jgi:hypothetical protein
MYVFVADERIVQKATKQLEIYYCRAGPFTVNSVDLYSEDPWFEYRSVVLSEVLVAFLSLLRQIPRYSD